MPTLFTLGCHSRSEIILRRSDDDTPALIRFNGHLCASPWKRFSVENFTCPLSLIDLAYIFEWRTIMNMQPIFAGVAALTMLTSPTYTASDLYGLTTVITDITDDTVTCIDFNGNEWQFTGAEDWAVDDIAALVMFNNGTPEIEDDEIITATYSGWTATSNN